MFERIAIDETVFDLTCVLTAFLRRARFRQHGPACGVHQQEHVGLRFVAVMACVSRAGCEDGYGFGSGVRVQYSTLNDYFTAVAAAGVTDWELKPPIDWYPYIDTKAAYWTGYFTRYVFSSVALSDPAVF